MIKNFKTHCKITVQITCSYNLKSRDSRYLQQKFYIGCCQACQKQLYFWQGVKASGHKGDRMDISSSKAKEWLDRLGSPQEQTPKTTAGDYSRRISRDTAKVIEEVLRRH